MQSTAHRSAHSEGDRTWSKERAWDWYGNRPWLVGCNFLPSTASNQLEMWQAESFDPDTISAELHRASDLGFNTVRVFLHNILWDIDAEGMLERIDWFLDTAARWDLQPILVLFDGVWGNRSYPGPQPEPIPGIHNSTWLQGPHPKVVVDQSQWHLLEPYVSGVIGHFASDDRVLMWDVYNEPGNEGLLGNTLPFLEAVVGWARDADPSQPITIGMWNWERPFNGLNVFQSANSDVVTFHTYERAEGVEKLITRLEAVGRPMVCTEYLARTMGSTFRTHLPIFKENHVGCLNWGLVAGRSQTMFPWDSARNASEPATWFHDILRSDGSPYDPDEVEFIQETTGAALPEPFERDRGIHG